MVARWRAHGAAAADPVGWCIAEALARRAAALHGPVRSLLLQRIAQRLSAHAGPPAPGVSKTDPGGRSALRGLVERLDGGRSRAARLSAEEPAGGPRAPAPLNAVTSYKGTWSRLRAEQRLRQALAQVPLMAGPLNSSQVVHRALQAIHGLSPAYLDAFMSHIDALLWLEQATGGDLPSRTAPKAAGTRRAGGSSRRY
jgi:hypothetical protein